MQSRPQRLHIGFFGKRNVGKSTLCNALSEQEISLVSEVAGTTTDPVEKVMELAPLGPVVLVDTAGFDDVGALGEKRVNKTRNKIHDIDIALLVLYNNHADETDKKFIEFFKEKNIPFGIVCNYRSKELYQMHAPINGFENILTTACFFEQGHLVSKQELIAFIEKLSPEQKEENLLAGIVSPLDLVVFVCPQDSGAPKGRLIMPQVQAIRSALDKHVLSLVLTEQEYASCYTYLAKNPNLVICDSQVVHAIASQTPDNVPLTTFSILMARVKADLNLLIQGVKVIQNLAVGDTVIIQEACSHHPLHEDIGRVKIPRMLEKKVGGKLNIQILAGRNFTQYSDFAKAKLIIHCGACSLTKMQTQQRILEAKSYHIPMTNYGMVLSALTGVLEKALSPFPETLAMYNQV